MGRHHREDGATAVEYGIVAGVLAIVFIAAGPALQDALTALMDVVLDQMGIG